MTIIQTMLCTILVFSIILLFKNENTYKNRGIINQAIHTFLMEKIKNHTCKNEDFTLWDAVEPYEATMWRLWDWGYTRILPKEDFELIKPYIQ